MKERQNREEMEALLAMHQSEGLTYRDLAEQSGVPIHTLNYWATKFRKEGEAEHLDPELLRVELLDQEQVRVIPVEIGGGIRLLVEPGFDAHHLRRLAQALSRSC